MLQAEISGTLHAFVEKYEEVDRTVGMHTRPARAARVSHTPAMSVSPMAWIVVLPDMFWVLEPGASGLEDPWDHVRRRPPLESAQRAHVQGAKHGNCDHATCRARVELTMRMTMTWQTGCPWREDPTNCSLPENTYPRAARVDIARPGSARWLWHVTVLCDVASLSCVT